MITMPAPTADFYHAMATAGAKAATAAEAVANTVQHGFLSCVTKVYNSLVTMKNAIAEGFHRLSEKMSPSSASSLAAKTIASMSADDTRLFCQQLKSQIPANPDGMFRESPSANFSNVLNKLKTPNQVLSALANQKINNVEASFLVKVGLEHTLAGNLFTADERRKLAENKDNREEVRKIFDSKFDMEDAAARENKDKFLSLFSVMQAYKTYADLNLDNTNRKYDPSVVSVVGIPRTFEFNEKRSLNTPADIALFKQEEIEAKTAFNALLKYCRPMVALKPAISRPD